ncbi:CCN1 [Mytilus edulis]|uniref:CYR61 n=1 Tax=Mytilus edulis TaxID=6550 RepID=A0A8S3TVJ9_MYTED|nr:CCN1 [Mytilus edulis]
MHFINDDHDISYCSKGITNINVNNAYDDYSITFTDDKQNNYSTNEKRQLPPRTINTRMINLAPPQIATKTVATLSSTTLTTNPPIKTLAKCYTDMDTSYCPDSCPDGQYCDGTECVLKSDCNCKIDGTIVESETFVNIKGRDCDECWCSNGTIECYPFTCLSSCQLVRTCQYKGRQYTTGQRWADGCDFDCTCIDGISGQYTCAERCPRYPQIPLNCVLVQDIRDPCCTIPSCSTVAPTPIPTFSHNTQQFDNIKSSSTITRTETSDQNVYNSGQEKRK